MTSSRARATTIILLACCALVLRAHGEEGVRTLPLLLPMPELLKRLEPPADWLLVPLAHYHELVAAGAPASAPSAPAPTGCWIESAQVQGRLGDDRALRLQAVLQVVALSPGPSALTLFHGAPQQLGVVSVDGATGLFMRAVSQLIIPAAGRHTVALHWSLILEVGNEGNEGSERSRHALLALPAAAATELRLESDTPGSFQAAGLVELSATPARVWRLSTPAVQPLELRWLPGLLAGEDQPVFGVRQELAVWIERAQRTWQWTGTLESRRGAPPAQLDLTLPAGFVLTATGPGVLGCDGSSGTVRLRLNGRPDAVSCSGFLAADAAIALPRVAAAAYAGGLVRLVSAEVLDYQAPAGWRANAAPIGGGAATLPAGFAVDTPDQGMEVAVLDDAGAATLTQSACLVVGPLAADWMITQQLEVSSAARRFTLPLQLPPGWRLRSFISQPPTTISELAEVGELARLAPGARLTLRCAAGFHQLAIRAGLERAEPAPARIELLTVPGAGRVRQRLSVLAAPGLELTLDAPPPWRLGVSSPAGLPPAPGKPAGAEAETRAELFSSGPPAAIGLTVAARPPHVSAEACWYVLPAGAGADASLSWGRLDLRLRVREGTLDALLLTTPFAGGASLQLNDRLFTLDTADGRVVLRARERWSGEHVLRLEGAFTPALSATLPHLTLARLEAPQAELPLREVVAVQAPTAGDLELLPTPSCVPLDIDELPAWSQPIPNAALVAAWRRQPTASDGPGAFRLVPRTLSPAPSGFIDHLEVRTQVAPQGTISVLRLRVAASSLQVLPLGLPPGTTLTAASVDGLPTAVRLAGADLVLPLPGRTQVEVALLLESGAPAHDFHLALPRFGELPVTRSAWTVAVASNWLAEPTVAGQAMPFPPVDLAAQRPWFSSWQAVRSALELVALPPSKEMPLLDARTLKQLPHAFPARGEPQLALQGTLLTGGRIGAPRELALHLVELSTLGALERCGRITAVLMALVIALRCAWRGRLALYAAAALGACALHHLAPSGIAALALALCEALLLMLPPAAAVVELLRRRPRLRATVPAAALALLLGVGAGLGTGLGAGEAPAFPEEVLMGYQELDAAGLPQGVQVALRRAALERLWRRAQPEVPTAAPLHTLASGAARYRLTVAGDALRGELVLPVAMLGDDWQQLAIPIGGGSVECVTFHALVPPERGGILPAPAPALTGFAAPVAPAAPTPTGDPAWTILDHELVVTLAPRLQGTLVVTLGWPLQRQSSTLVANPSFYAVHGGSLRLDTTAAPGLVPACNLLLLQREGDPGGHLWSADLPLHESPIELSFSRPEGVLAQERRLALVQELRAALLPGRLEWSDEARIAIQGTALREVRLDLPAGLLVTAVSGPALAAWRQQGEVLALSWSAEQLGECALHLSGVIPGARAGSAGVVPRLPGAGRSSGRLVLVNGADARFIRPEHPGIARADPPPGADLALHFDDDPQGLDLAWQPLQGDLRLSEQCALVAGPDQVRATLIATLDGHGERADLRLRLPAPWQPGAAPSGVSVSVRGSGEARELVLRAPAGWHAGERCVLTLSAERHDLGERFSAPDLTPVGGQPVLERQEWLLGDAGDRRLAAVQATASDALAIDALAAAMARVGATLRGTEHWRAAFARRPGPPPGLELRADGSRVQVSASHYLVLGQEQLRWWAHLTYAIEQGELSELHVTLPAGATLASVSAPDLGSWSVINRELVARLAAPARARASLDLELTLPAGAALTAAAISTPPGAPLVAQQVALVEEDEQGLVRRDPQGLEEEPPGARGLALPVGVDDRQVRHRWHAVRPDWQLAITREALAASGGVDGIATLVDVLSVIATEGELRGRASWQVLNRTRAQLALTLPVGVELWEARVNGEVVRPRLRDSAPAPAAGPTQLWLPVRPMRPGESALRITLTWRERVNLAGRFTPHLPLLSELRTMQVLWRLVPPVGEQLEREDGDLRVARLGEAEAASARAHAVIAELQRLHSLGDLGEVALRRLGDQLGVLDAELSDYLVSLGTGAPGAAAANQAVIGEVTGNRAQLQSELTRIGRLTQEREARRKALGLGNAVQLWAAPAAPAAATQDDDGPLSLPRLRPASLPWPAPLAVGAGGALGAGEPPPGYRQSGGGSLLGVDLVGDPGAGGLQLQGDGFAVVLSLHRTGASWWPSLLLGAALALAVAGLWRRRAGG